MGDNLLIQGRRQDYQVERYESNNLDDSLGAILPRDLHALSSRSIAHLMARTDALVHTYTAQGMAMFFPTNEHGPMSLIAHVPDIYFKAEGLSPMDDARMSQLEGSIYDTLHKSQNNGSGLVVPIEDAEILLAEANDDRNALMRLLIHGHMGKSTIKRDAGDRVSVDIEKALADEDEYARYVLGYVLGTGMQAYLEAYRGQKEIGIWTPSSVPEYPTAYLITLVGRDVPKYLSSHYGLKLRPGDILLNHPLALPRYLLAARAVPRADGSATPRMGPMDLETFEQAVASGAVSPPSPPRTPSPPKIHLDLEAFEKGVGGGQPPKASAEDLIKALEISQPPPQPKRRRSTTKKRKRPKTPGRSRTRRIDRYLGDK
jgi:hypothetical protein